MKHKEIEKEACDILFARMQELWKGLRPYQTIEQFREEEANTINDKPKEMEFVEHKDWNQHQKDKIRAMLGVPSYFEETIDLNESEYEVIE